MSMVKISSQRSRARRREDEVCRLRTRAVIYAAEIGVPLPIIRGPVSEFEVRLGPHDPPTNQQLPTVELLHYPELVVAYAEHPAAHDRDNAGAQPGLWVFRRRNGAQLRHDGSDPFRFTEVRQIAAVADHPADLS